MLSKLLLAALVAASATVPAVAKDDGSKTTICHRTGSRPIQGLFPGHVIEVANTALAQHIPGHGDVVLTPAAKEALGSGGGKRTVCLTDANGNVFDANGNPVEGGGGPAGPS